MRVVVSVKPTPGGGQTSQATRYIAYRERDEEREGTEPRPLFSAKEETLSFWRAERVLTADRAPTKDELLHIAVSFHEEDFHSLGGKEADRQQALKEVTREAVDQFKEDLNVDELRWVAGIHRNTDNPHIHLLLHRDSVDRDTGLERRINRLPESALPSRITDETGIEKIEPGSLGRAFELALDRARERELSRVAIREKTPTSDDILVEAARQNPSLAGRQLTTEIILRGPAREPGERPDDTDLRSAFQVRSLDDPDYRTQPEQADWLGARSQTMRDLYERGTMLKGDVLVIPAEDHELPTDRDQPFITSLSYAHERIQNPVQAAEFHTLARTIAGETADPRTEIEGFRHYYDRVRHDAERDRTLDEMRLLADEMAKLETRESIEAAFTVESFPDRANEGRESAFNTAARKVRLDEDSLRLPSGIPFEMKQQLVSRTLPAIDRQLETGRARAEILAAIDGSTYRPELSEFEQDERRRIGQFLKGYVGERLRDPETRALNRSPAFRMAHAQIVEARTPKELNRAAETFLRQNLERSHDPKPDATPLSARERSLLFFGRAPDHHTPEMRDLRHAWGLSRTERAARESNRLRSQPWSSRASPARSRTNRVKANGTGAQAVNEEPQPQVVLAFGFRITNCAPRRSSR